MVHFKAISIQTGLIHECNYYIFTNVSFPETLCKVRKVEHKWIHSVYISAVMTTEVWIALFPQSPA